MRIGLLTLAAILLLGGGIAHAEDISGPIVVTKTIFEDSQLVGDVTCAPTATPCIDSGHPTSLFG